MSFNQIGQIASGVLQYDFDFITGTTEKAAELLTISGSLSGHVGQLNVLINQSFGYTGSGGDVNPPLQEEEKEILVQLYIKDYYFKEARRCLEAFTTQVRPQPLMKANGLNYAKEIPQ